MNPLVLASTSPFRLRILTEAGLPVRTVAPGVDESLDRQADPGSRALAIALRKSRTIALEPGEIGIAADQVAFDPLRGTIFGKPATDAEQVRRLLDLGGRSHTLHTGWVVWCSEWREAGVEVSTVTLRPVTESEAEAYAAHGEARGCAGGYAVEGQGSFLVERIEGDWFNVVGLPLYRIHAALRAHGWRYGGAG